MTWSRLVQVHGLVDFVHVGVVLVAALGAARVRVHGLVNCVRDGVLFFLSLGGKSLLTDSGWCLFRMSTECWTFACMLQRQVRTALVPMRKNHRQSVGHCQYATETGPHSSCCAEDRWVQLLWCCGVTVIMQLFPAVQVVRFSRDSVRQAVLVQGC